MRGDAELFSVGVMESSLLKGVAWADGWGRRGRGGIGNEPPAPGRGPAAYFSGRTLPPSLNMCQVTTAADLVTLRVMAIRRKQAMRKGDSVDGAAMIGASRAATASWSPPLDADGLAVGAGAATAAGLVDGAVVRGLRLDVRPMQLA